MARKIVISNTPPYFINLDAPTLPAFEMLVGSVKIWRVWCSSCKTWHDHGAGEGHRTSHCTDPSSPYHSVGYNLTYAGQWDSRSIQDIDRVK
jgi:hypothetical protein